MGFRIKLIVIFLLLILAFLIYKTVFTEKTSEIVFPKFTLIEDNMESDQVTKIIHFSWKTKEIPLRFERYLKSWTDFCYKDWKFLFWTDEDNYSFIKTHYPWFIEKYNGLSENINRADVSRYFYLFHYGGIYTDLDNECLRPFEHLLKNYSLVFGAMKGQYRGTKLKEGYVQNSFMYSKPRQTFWLELISDVMNFNGKQYPEASTGPILLSNRIDLYRKRQPDNNGIIIYLPHYFNPFSWIKPENVDPNCKSHNKMTEENLSKCRQSMIKKGSYIVQYHAHTWG